MNPAEPPGRDIISSSSLWVIWSAILAVVVCLVVVAPWVIDNFDVVSSLAVGPRIVVCSLVNVFWVVDIFDVASSIVVCLVVVAHWVVSE